MVTADDGSVSGAGYILAECRFKKIGEYGIYKKNTAVILFYNDDIVVFYIAAMILFILYIHHFIILKL